MLALQLLKEQGRSVVALGVVMWFERRATFDLRFKTMLVVNRFQAAVLVGVRLDDK